MTMTDRDLILIAVHARYPELQTCTCSDTGRCHLLEDVETLIADGGTLPGILEYVEFAVTCPKAAQA